MEFRHDVGESLHDVGDSLHGGGESRYDGGVPVDEAALVDELVLPVLLPHANELATTGHVCFFWYPEFGQVRRRPTRSGAFENDEVDVKRQHEVVQ